MTRIQTTVALVSWEALMVFVNGFNIITVIALFLALPVMGFALYLIWFDSKKPKDKQFSFYNSRFGK